MSLNTVSSGSKAPEEINVIIEVPAHSDPVKYEVDKDSGTLFVDRFMAAAMHYPCNYGYVPQTLADDGDPVDVLVMTPFPLLSGAVIPCRPVGMLIMTDESGKDSKILAVPADKLCLHYRHIKKLADVPEHLCNSISHFFKHYKDLEPHKWVEIGDWQDVEQAYIEITNGIAHYKPVVATT